MDGMEFWGQFEECPKEYLGEIKAGRLKGKADIRPQWRYMAMTRVFGPCGIGWKYTIDNTWTLPGSGDEVLVFVQIGLYTKDAKTGTWTSPIPAIGGSKLVINERNGMYNNDEAYKMATTDALGVAMAKLGVAAKVYLGLWDGSKYSTPIRGEFEPPKTRDGFGNSKKEEPNGEEPKKDLPKFSWSKANSAQRLAYVIKRIAEIESQPDKGKVADNLKAMSLKIKSSDFSPEDIDKVRDALLDAESRAVAESEE